MENATSKPRKSTIGKNRVSDVRKNRAICPHSAGRETDFLTLKITEASEFLTQMETDKFSEDVQLCDFRWQLVVEVEEFKGTPCLHVLLDCSSNADELWTCKASCVVRVVHKGGEDLTKRAHCTFSTGQSILVLGTFSVKVCIKVGRAKGDLSALHVRQTSSYLLSLNNNELEDDRKL